MEQKPFKTDRNGTEYFHDWTCPRCGGAGFWDGWKNTGMTCYSCGGSGRRSEPKVVKVYTAEYQAILDARSQARHQKKLAEKLATVPERKAQWMDRCGFNEKGQTFLYYGNSYELKDQLKASGAKFNGSYWRSKDQLDLLPSIMVTFDEMCEVDQFGEIGWKEEAHSIIIERLEEAEKAIEPESHHIGEIGQKLEMKLALKRWIDYQTQFGRMNIFIFEDEAGNILTWKTSGSIPTDAKEEWLVRFTVKAHTEYNGKAQTEIIRPKFQG